MSTVSEIWVKINSDISGLQRGLLAGGTELKAFSTTASRTAGSTSASASKIQTSYGGVGGTIQKLGPVFIAAGALAAVGIGKGIAATQEWAGEVKSLQRVTGQSAEDASRLATAANTLGVSTSTLTTGFGLLSKNIINGSANLEKYGITTKDATGKTLPFNDILGNISDKFLTLKPGIDQAAFAQNVFGKGGKALIPILAQGRAGLAALEAEADKYGTTLSQKDLDAARALSIAQKQLGEAFKGTEISLGRDFIPILTSLTNDLKDVLEVVHLIPQPVISTGLAFAVLAGGAAAAGKVVGFLQTGWSKLGETLGITAKTTQIASDALTTNTDEVVANTVAQTSWGVEVNSASNAVNAAADVVDAGTKATEASTSATVADIAAQKAKTTVSLATTGATARQVVGQRALFDATLLGTGAVGDAAAAQGVLFDATNLTTTAIERQRAIQAVPIPAGGTGGAGVFALANAPLAAAAAVVYGLAKSVGFAKEEFTGFYRVLAEHQATSVNVVQGVGAISKAMQFLGFAVPGVNDNIGDFTKGVKDVQAGLQDGSISFDQARVKVGDLAKQYGITNLDVNTFTDNLGSEVGVVDEAAVAAEKHARAVQTQGLAIRSLIPAGSTASHILGLMGESATQFASDARAAFTESDASFRTWAKDLQDKAAAAWQQFRDSARTSITFTTGMLGDLESSAKSAQQTLAGDTSGLSEGALATLRAQAHLTATDILHTFQAAKAQTVSFSRDLLEIGKVGGQAGKDLANSFLQAGDVLAAQVVADAPKKLQEKIVGAFGASEHAADTFSTKLTNAIVGPLDDISGLLERIARHFGIDVSFLDHGASGKIGAINTQLKALAGRHRGEIDLNTTQAMAALAALIAREHQAFSGGSGPVSVHQVHQGGLVMHAGGQVAKLGLVDWQHMTHTPQFHAGGTVSWAHQLQPTKLPEFTQNVWRMHVGGLNSDEVPAVLQRGEFVIRKHAVERIGIPRLRELNRMHEGGHVIQRTVERLHEGGLAQPAFMPVTKRGQMVLWTAPDTRAGADPIDAVSFWNRHVGQNVVRRSLEKSQSTVYTTGDLVSNRYAGLAWPYGTNRAHIQLNDAVHLLGTGIFLRTMEHEMGHEFGLHHVTSTENIMNPDHAGTGVTGSQVSKIKEHFHAPRIRQQLHSGGLIDIGATLLSTLPIKQKDEIPVILQVGEFVLRRDAVRNIGVPALEALNEMHSGGPVVPSLLPSSSPGGLDEDALERAFRKALRAELPGALLNQRVKLNVDRRKLSRSLDDDLLSDGHW